MWIDIGFTRDEHLWCPLLLYRPIANGFHLVTLKVNPLRFLTQGKALGLGPLPSLTTYITHSHYKQKPYYL